MNRTFAVALFAIAVALGSSQSAFAVAGAVSTSGDGAFSKRSQLLSATLAGIRAKPVANDPVDAFEFAHATLVSAQIWKPSDRTYAVALMQSIAGKPVYVDRAFVAGGEPHGRVHHLKMDLAPYALDARSPMFAVRDRSHEIGFDFENAALYALHCGRLLDVDHVLISAADPTGTIPDAFTSTNLMIDATPYNDLETTTISLDRGFAVSIGVGPDCRGATVCTYVDVEAIAGTIHTCDPKTSARRLTRDVRYVRQTADPPRERKHRVVRGACMRGELCGIRYARNRRTEGHALRSFR